VAEERHHFLAKYDSMGEYQWVRDWPGLDPEDVSLKCVRVVTDADGNAIMSGNVKSSDVQEHNDAGTPSAVKNPSDAYLVKFDSGGNELWRRRWGNGMETKATALAVDRDGDTYVAGSFDGEVDLDPGPGVDMQTGPGAYLSKFDKDGNLKWARTWKGVHSATWSNVDINDIGLDQSGSLYFVGGFIGTIDFDPGKGVSERTSGKCCYGPTDNAFICKISADGAFGWVKTWGDTSPDNTPLLNRTVASRIAVGSDTIFVAGNFNGNVNFNPGAEKDYRKTADPVNDEIYLLFLGIDGTYKGAKPLRDMISGTVADGYVHSLAIDASGNVIMAPIIYLGTADYDDPKGGIRCLSMWDSYTVSSDPQGNTLWFKKWETKGPVYIRAIAADAAGCLYTTGGFSGTIDLDPGPVVDEHASVGADEKAPGSEDMFLVKFRPNADK
jgi:hypothetical protein